MNSPINDDQDDLDRTDKLPVLHMSDLPEDLGAFDPAATVVIDPAVQARVEELERRLATREQELSGLREALVQQSEVAAELEGGVERLRAQARAREQEVAELRDAAGRLAAAERTLAAINAELERQRGEAAELRSALDAAGREREQSAAERELER
jgi:uncharacterized coiled-coil protein SlyX